MKTYHEQRADRLDAELAKPFRERTKAKYREARTAADLYALSRACWKERDAAVRMANRYTNHSAPGNMDRYDKYDFLAADAEEYAKEFYRKAKRIEAGEAPEVVMPHLAKPA